MEYQGTNYHGFQYQNNASSIQEEVEKAIERVTGAPTRIKGAGRTDAGVHAKGQVAAFDTESRNSPNVFRRALNYYLPDDIAVKAAYNVSSKFDPRRDALSRKYMYRVVNSVIRSPIRRLETSQIREPLDVPSMNIGAKLFEGIHNFARFAGPLEYKRASTIREILSYRIEIQEDELRFAVEGNAFLPHQVRRMTGALVDVGRGNISLKQLNQMIEGDDNGVISHSMPSMGLCLIEVKYTDFPPKDGEQNAN